MNRTIRRLAMVMPLCLAAAGCVADPDQAASSSSDPAIPADQQADLSTLTYRAVDLILAAAPQVTDSTPLVVTSLSNTKDLERSSALGNIVADMIRTRLAQTGHRTSEIRLRSAVSLKQGDGEFLLSRNRRALRSDPAAAAVMTGTYATSDEKAYVSLKLISTADAHIISGADFVVPLDDVLGLVNAQGK
ncbi:FlgO family outer membrane protein [Acidisphaera sp. S103]|uniref:FlgO family outer membrane protein n=1 Tax=Acidisphaera sp. S103 TaxID=1747223 RepID=UPI00131CC5DD|nr:FlgO family outer membrane protein [Acidisphaera sp. S103]